MNNLFDGCSSLTSLVLSNLNISSDDFDMSNLFDGCSSLISLVLFNFNISSDDFYMSNLFNGCSSLTSLVLSNFNISSRNILHMDNLLNGSSLISLVLSNFNILSRNILHMDSLFNGCLSLTSLVLSNFNILSNNILHMDSLFNGCSSLISLVLSNFNIISWNIAYMNNWFYGCLSLTSLDLSNFTISLRNIVYMENWFYGSVNLEFINLYNFDDNEIDKIMNYNGPTNVVLCIKTTTDNNIINNLKNKYECLVIDCSEDWKSKQKKIINNNGQIECVDSCTNSPQYKYEYNGYCYESCEYGYLYDDNNNSMNMCKCESEKCSLCSHVALYKGLCTKCNKNYYPKENDTLNVGEYINCYNEQQEGYYLDNNIYKKCYKTCKTCNETGNDEYHKCITCNQNFPFNITKNNYTNCYENSSYKYNSYYENIEELKNILKNEKNETQKSKEEEIKYYDNIIKNIEDIFTSEKYDTSKLDNGEDDYINLEKMKVILTTTENQRNNINNNMTSIDLRDCETLIKNSYNISINETLYMKIIELVQENTKTSKVEYDIYYKLFNTNLIKLNVTACSNSKISIMIPFVIKENIDKFNISSGYYNDICYTTTSENGTDISLNDRRKNYIDENNIVCQEDCKFTKYNSKNYKAECLCSVKESSKSIADMTIDKKKLFENFKNIKNFANFNFLVCYKKLFQIKGIIKNIGSYILMSILFFHIISIIIFRLYQYSLINKKIKDIAFAIEHQSLEKGKKKEIIKNKL